MALRGVVGRGFLGLFWPPMNADGRRLRGNVMESMTCMGVAAQSADSFWAITENEKICFDYFQ